ncbi:hypothetical protein HZA45_03715 [Candidatus Peregrinibacteria bacterium]|nr:hypothetical protein [Candidatus Peregrinibacteria bacterium]
MTLLLRTVDLLVRGYARFERRMFLILGGLFLASLTFLLIRFYYANTVLVPTTGGTYIEGSVGDLQPLNPWFTVTNDVNRDIVSLVFAGLLKYNPESKKIEEDLATMRASNDSRVYTLTLRENLFWHDSTKKVPHPVTADDVLFTFRSIQDPEFPNQLLRQNFRGVSIEKIDERAVQFRLDAPYSFFPSNLTLGLLPKKSFEGIPVKLLDQALDFGFAPVGAGPYRLKSLVQTELSTEITLERFERGLPPAVHLDSIIFRIFSDYPTLLSDLRSLDGIRTVPRTSGGEPAVPKRFTAVTYSLPQYVALFFNMDRTVVSDQQLRLGLQLGTNKQDVVNAIGESVIVDTPLLELASSDWRYHFDPEAAQGALFASAWYFPEKVRLQRLLEQREANSVGPIKIDPIVLLDTGAVLVVTGALERASFAEKLNGVRLKPLASTGTWTVSLPTSGTGALRMGENLLKLTDQKGRILDSFYVWRTENVDEYRLASEEQRLVDLFLESKGTALPAAKRIAVKDLVLDKGFLRLRVKSDPVGIRINDAGKKLTITILTSPSPEKYKTIAENIRRQWALLGVQVKVEVPATRKDFEDRLLKRDYDVVLFGQSLLDNLDSYPYWHSSGNQRITGNRNDLRLDAYNLSQYHSFEADTFLETVRRTMNDREREDALKKLREVLKRDVPAVFLYSPLYTFAYREDIQGVTLGHLSLHSDRFLSLYKWYVEQDRVFRSGESWLSFFGWLSSAHRTDTTVVPVSGTGSSASSK